MKISARNQLKGIVKSLHSGPVHTEVLMELPGGQGITAVITSQSAQAMGLAEGVQVVAIVKSSHVMVGIE